MRGRVEERARREFQLVTVVVVVVAVVVVVSIMRPEQSGIAAEVYGCIGSQLTLSTITGEERRRAKKTGKKR